MSGAAGWAIVGLLAGWVIGALSALLYHARRDQAVRIELEVLRGKLKSEEALARERDLALERLQISTEAALGELTRASLKSNSETFLKLAGERLGRDQSEAQAALKERETAIEAMIGPVREALSKAELQIQRIERERIDAFAGIRSQMEQLSGGQALLSRETRNLVTALRRPEVRGRWGEMTLRRLVELAGLSAHVDFSEQRHVVTESGAIRPDMVVHMPERRDIVIDVKTPLDAYLSAIEAQSEEDRGRELKRHAQTVGARVRELASKQYWSQFEHSPDFVVLFLPGDQFLSAALEVNPELIDSSLTQNVMLATPSTLIALLKTVALGWKQSALAENAAEIRGLGEDLFKRLATFAEHLGRLGKSLGNSVDSFNRAVGSLDTQVLPAARRFPELGLRVNRELEPLEPIDITPRTPNA